MTPADPPSETLRTSPTQTSTIPLAPGSSRTIIKEYDFFKVVQDYLDRAAKTINLQEFVRTTVLPNRAKFLDVSSARDQLRRAEELFRQTLARDSGLTDARLHRRQVQQSRHTSVPVHSSKLQASPQIP